MKDIEAVGYPEGKHDTIRAVLRPISDFADLCIAKSTQCPGARMPDARRLDIQCVKHSYANGFREFGDLFLGTCLIDDLSQV